MNNQKISTIATPTKVCFKCNQEKPLSEFPLRSDSPDGYRNDCKVCGAKRKRAWAEANRERVAETKRAWEEANREKVAENVARYRSKYPERHPARQAVNNAIRDGKLPSPRDLPCSVCGGSAEEYHHYLGYSLEHRLDVVAVCPTCHIGQDK